MEEKVVYIVGLGLIGASLDMGIRKAHPQVTLLGYNRSQASRDIALKKGIVDGVTSNLEEFASRADVIIVSLPVKQTIQTAIGKHTTERRSYCDRCGLHQGGYCRSWSRSF